MLLYFIFIFLKFNKECLIAGCTECSGKDTCKVCVNYMNLNEVN